VFQQLLTPVADNLFYSFMIALLPVVVVLVLLGVFRRPAWQASLAGLLIALVVSVGVWQLPVSLAFNSVAAGMTFAIWPIMWIVFNALTLYNVAVASGRFDAFRDWTLANLPNDRRVILVVIGFCFGALLEGVAGFGAPVAITTALLIMVGFPALEALVFTLIFNTAPVAFGALGSPVVTLAAVTGLSDTTLGAMIGRQLPFIAILLPFYVIGVYGGRKSLAALWPVLLVAGGSFAFGQFLSSNVLSYHLTNVLSALVSLGGTLLFLRFWKPAPDPEYAVVSPPKAAVSTADGPKPIPPWQGWLPWLVISGVVIIWSTLRINLIGGMPIEWPGLHNEIFITLYEQPYAAVWNFQPLATGTAILLSSVLTALLVGLGLKGYLGAVKATWMQIRLATLTVTLIVGLAYLMNYSGMNYTLGLGVASAGLLFPLLSPFLGWLAVFLSGSVTAGNALFGNLQVVAARELDLDPVLFAASNSSGGVMGKMISPQNIATGAAVTDLKGREGEIMAITFKHSIILTLVLSVIVMLQQYVFPWMVPG
jgi:lactate permease